MISLASHKLVYEGFKQWLINAAICARTLGKYPHSELVIGPPGTHALCFSATSSEGVREATRNVIDGSWNLITLTLTEFEENYIHTLISEIKGSAYGWDSIWRFILRSVKDNIDTYDCSDAVAVTLVRCGYLREVEERDCWKVSPSALQKMVLRREAELAKERTG